MIMARQRMATSSSPPESRKAEAAAAAAAGASSSTAAAVTVWSSCCCLSSFLIFAVGLFYCCCAPRAMAIDQMPPTMRDIISFWGVHDSDVSADAPYHAQPERLWKNDREWAFFDTVHPEASQLRKERLPIPCVIRGELEFEESDYREGEEREILFDFNARSPQKNTFGAHHKSMDRVIQFFMEDFVSDDGMPDIESLPEKTRHVLATQTTVPGYTVRSSIVRDAVSNDAYRLVADVRRDADGNVELLLSYPETTWMNGSKAIFWNYSAKFKSDANKLIPIEDILTLKEMGDASKDTTVGKWILNEKIVRSFDNTDLKSWKSHYYWNLECSDKFNPHQLKYEYTWNIDFKGDNIFKESFLGRTPIYQNNALSTDQENLLTLPKCRKLIMTWEHDLGGTGVDRDLIETVVETTNRWKIHHYFMRKSYHWVDSAITWNGIATSNPDLDLSISFDEIPLNFEHHFGIRRRSNQRGNCNWELHSDNLIRYACMKTSSYSWFVHAFFMNPMRMSCRNFSYTSEDLNSMVELPAAGPANFLSLYNVKIPHIAGVECTDRIGLLKDIFTCPVESGKITWANQKDELSQVLKDPIGIFDGNKQFCFREKTRV